MTKSSKKKRKAARRSPAKPHPQAAEESSVILFAAGLLLLAAGVAMTLMLVLNHFGGIKLPGCGPGSPCASAAASWWGKVPGTAWPISFVGLAYFGGLLAAWITSRQGVTPPLRLLVRFGVTLSLMYVIVLIVEKHLCYYCLGTHAANIGFWLILEQAKRRTSRSPVAFGSACGTFLLISVGLYAAESRTKQLVEQSQEKDRGIDTEDHRGDERTGTGQPNHAKRPNEQFRIHLECQ